MAKQVKQFRYYQEEIDGEESKLNWPADLRACKLISGSAFKEFFPIIQLGIQALPGTKFYLNHSENPVIVGMTGTYEINLENKAEITALQFDPTSIIATRNNNNAYIIIDIIYDDGEG